MTETKAGAKVEYWKERLEEMRGSLDETRRQYAEARERGASQEELRTIAKNGQRIADRIQVGERMIAEEEARLTTKEE